MRRRYSATLPAFRTISAAESRWVRLLEYDCHTGQLVDFSGGSNIRSRLAYDADGHVVATFQPWAFASSTTTPDAST